ncbi:MAG: DUF2490 domain-containing protein [Chitinophagales bacterium]|nr:DUF2490 domain-containing protein [Chitinophagales bacterium]
MKKRLLLHWILAIFVLISTNSTAFSKLEDTQSRTEVNIQYSPIKKLEISGMYRLDLEENLSQFKKNNFELGLSYDVLKSLEISTYYRFSTSYKNDAHRFYLGLSTKKSLFNKILKFKLSSGIQFDSDYLDAEYWRLNDPSFRWVSKVSATYNINKKWDISAYIKPYFSLNGHKNFLQKVRYGAEINYSIDKRNSLSLGYFYEQKPHSKKVSDIQTFSLGYKLDLKAQKKKTKK